MPSIDGASRAVLEAAEWVSIGTAGSDGPHLAATWGDYVRALGVDWDAGGIVIPMGGMARTEANLAHDSRVELVSASRSVAGPHGPGQGFVLRGHGEVVTTGPDADRVRQLFPWARAALVVRAHEVRTLL